MPALAILIKRNLLTEIYDKDTKCSATNLK